MVDNLRDQLIRDEGDVPYAYQDSLGYWTTVIGFYQWHRNKEDERRDRCE